MARQNPNSVTVLDAGYIETSYGNFELWVDTAEYNRRLTGTDLADLFDVTALVESEQAAEQVASEYRSSGLQFQ